MAFRGKHAKNRQFDVVLGRRILGIRKMRRLSRESLSTLLGMSSRDLQHYETGKRRMQADLLIRLATILNVRISTFFADDRAPSSTVMDRSFL
jgi:transcriptional regulator with XRE-family HTH domain